jgi:hypothetical protein
VQSPEFKSQFHKKNSEVYKDTFRGESGLYQKEVENNEAAQVFFFEVEGAWTSLQGVIDLEVVKELHVSRITARAITHDHLRKKHGGGWGGIFQSTMKL